MFCFVRAFFLKLLWFEKSDHSILSEWKATYKVMLHLVAYFKTGHLLATWEFRKQGLTIVKMYPFFYLIALLSLCK